MPTSVLELFESAGLSLAGPVSWGQQIGDDQPGVYVVSLFPKDKEKSLLKVPPV